MRQAVHGEYAVVKRVEDKNLILETASGEEIFLECTSNAKAMEGLDGFKGKQVRIDEDDDARMIVPETESPK